MRVLGTLFSDKASKKQKIDMLKEYEIPITESVERKVDGMRTLGDLLEERAEKRGEEKTIVEAIRNLMKNLKLTPEQSMDALSIPEEERAVYRAQVQ